MEIESPAVFERHLELDRYVLRGYIAARNGLHNGSPDVWSEKW
jgi:hypothetical protein